MNVYKIIIITVALLTLFVLETWAVPQAPIYLLLSNQISTCSDGICNGTELCSTCEVDCGVCSAELTLLNEDGERGTYYLRPHPARVFMDAALATEVVDPDGSGAGISPKATGPAWTALQNVVNDCVAPQQSFSGNCTVYVGLLAALGWTMDNSQNDYRDYALTWLNHPEREIDGHFSACFEASTYCGVSNEHHYNHVLLETFASLYNLMRNELTPAERATFADKMLADEEQGCENQLRFLAEVEVNGTSVTAADTTALAAGMPVWINGWNRVETIDSLTTLSLTLDNDANTGTQSMYYAPPWETGMCGLKWYLAHHSYTPEPLVGGGSTALSGTINASQTTITLTNADNLAPYLPFIALIGPEWSPNGEWVRVTGHNGNSITIERGALESSPQAHADGSRVLWRKYARGGGIAGSDPTHNHTVGKTSQYMQLFLALAVDDPRATADLEALQPFWISEVLAANRRWTTEIFNQGGQYYWAAMHVNPNFKAALALLSSTTPAIDITNGRWLLGIMMNPVYLSLPDNPTQVMWWGQAFTDNNLASWNQEYVLIGQHLFGQTPEAAYAKHWYRNVASYWNNSELSSYGGRDNILYALVHADDGDAGSDYTTAIQPHIVARNTDLGDPVDQLGGFISKSSWETSATMLGVFAYDRQLDHTIWGNPASYNIYRQGVLLAEDGNNPPNVGDGVDKNVLQFGNAVVAGNQNNEIDRAFLDANGRFAYARVDVSDWYDAGIGITRALRHFVHLKSPGTQDYVVVYDDTATSSPTTISQAITYSNEDTTFDNGLVISTGSGNRLSSRVLLPTSGVSLIPSSGNADRERLLMDCGYTSDCEFLIAHRPSIDTADTMPAAVLLNAGSSFRAVQIEGSDPKVVIFGRNGANHSSVSLTTDYNGTAQILILGLTPGDYTVTVNGTEVTGSPFSVNAGEEALYFESMAGNVLINGI